MSVKVKGMAKLSRNLSDIATATSEEIRTALTEEAQKVLQIADPITPMDTGALRKSGRVIAPPKNATRRIIARIRWGGAKAPYAAWVHEMPSHYNYTTPGTGPKYAQRAAQSLMSSLPAHVAKKIGARLIRKFPATKRRSEATITVNLGT